MATDLGQLIYTLTLNDAGFVEQTAAADASMRGLGVSAQASAGAIDTAGAAAATGEGMFAKLGETIKSTVLPLAAMFGIYEGGRALIGEVITAVKDHQAAQSTLTTSLQNTHDAIGFTVEQLNALADANSRNSTISTTANEQAEAVLLNYNAIGHDVFPAAAKAVDDLATKMNHGLPPSMDQTNQAAKMLGRALEDPKAGMNALTRMGVAFSESQKTAIKAMMSQNDTAGAQKLILQDLSEVVGGQAAAAQDTLGGKMAVVHNTLDRLSAAASDSIKSWLPKLGDSFNHIADLLVKFLGPALSDLWKTFKTQLLPALEQLWTALQPLLPIIGVVLVIAIRVMIQAITLWVQWMSFIITVTAQVAQGLESLIGWIGNVVSTIVGVLGGALNWLSSHWPLILAILTGPFGLAVDWIVTHWTQITDFFKGLPGMIAGWLGGIFDAITAPFRQAFDWIKDHIKPVIDALSHLNPFAKHSPSLVENIQAGTAVIQQHYADMFKNISSMGGKSPFGNVLVGNTPNTSQGTSNSSVVYNFSAGAVQLTTKDAVDEFFSIGNRNTQLESLGMSPLAGTTHA